MPHSAVQQLRAGSSALALDCAVVAEDQPRRHLRTPAVLPPDRATAEFPEAQTLTISLLRCQPARYKLVLALFGYGSVKSQATHASLALAYVFIKYYGSS